MEEEDHSQSAVTFADGVVGPGGGSVGGCACKCVCVSESRMRTREGGSWGSCEGFGSLYILLVYHTYRYFLRCILPFANLDLSRYILVLDICVFVFVKDNINQRE
jgi:hypothetical protein